MSLTRRLWSVIPPDTLGRARLRVIEPGKTIFEQNTDSREYLYLIVEGECKCYRDIPDCRNTCTRVEMGSSFFPGDFSFMDGETQDWAEVNASFHNEMMSKVDDYTGKRHMFGQHRYTLVRLALI